MNICIGGPWHGSKILGRIGPRKIFTVKDNKSGNAINYSKMKITVQDKSYVLWISDDITHIERNDLIEKYFNKITSY